MCPTDWVGYQDSCYFVESTKTSTYGIASTACTEQGATLTSVSNAEEQTFLAGKLGRLVGEGADAKRGSLKF